jgi:D-tyrosyl-tRNA(Tyr) deacylase
MRVIVQRCSNAKCIIDNKVFSEIDFGYMLLVGFTKGDDENKISKMIKKIINLRIFEDENGKMNLNIKQVNGKVLSISQFTLYANTNDGNRPSFTEALEPSQSTVLYDKFNNLLSNELEVKTGIFGAEMHIDFVNDGPCTIFLEF